MSELRRVRTSTPAVSRPTDPRLADLADLRLVEYCGFVTGAEKSRLFREADVFCFPTYYPAESFGLVVLEAMAHGLAGYCHELACAAGNPLV